jgi:hypothetical protein
MSRRGTSTIALIGLLLLAATAEPMQAATAEEVRQGSSAQVGVPWRGSPGITESVAQIMARDRRTARTRPQKVVEEPPPLRPALERVPGPASPDPAPAGSLDSAAAVPPTPGVSFLAVTLGEADVVPPDTMGSVGPDQILVHTNGRVKLFDKTGTPAPSGTPLDVTDDAFWASVRNGFPVSDPHVEYDRLSGRWFLTIINIPLVMGNPMGPNRILIAVSSGSTITNTSSFTFFQFEVDDPPPGTDANRFGDYPTLGVDANAVYIGINMFDQAATFFQNTTAFVIDKADLLADTLTVTAFRNLISMPSFDGPFTPQAATNQDPNATQGYFVGVDAAVSNELNVLRISDPVGTPTLSRIDIAVPTTRLPLDVPQPSSAPLLDAIDDRIFEVIVQRLPGGEPRLWLAHNLQVNASGTASDTGGRTGSRWYELGTLSATPTVIQHGTIFDPAASQPFSYWMPSIAANGQGHAVIGMSRAGASPTGHARVAVAERLAGEPPGTMSAPSLVQSSTFLYDTLVPGTERWGDYSQTVIDPNDNMTFWTFQEYTNATNSWGVRVIELKAPPPAIPSFASPRNLSSSASIPIDITGTSIDGSGFFDPGPDTGGPGFLNHLEASADGGIVVNDVTFTAADEISLDLDTTGDTGGIKTLTVTNPDGQSVEACGLFGVGNDGDTTAPTAPVPVSPADGAAAPSLPTLSWQAAVDADCNVAKYQLFLNGVLHRDDIGGGATTTTPVAPLSPGTYTWRIRALDDAGNFTDSANRTFTVQAPPEPKQVALKAKPKKVEKGKRVRLKATVSPCAGHGGDVVDLFRGKKRIATKATTDACVAGFRVKMRKTARFRAISPQQDGDHLEGVSKKVKVRVI